MNDEPMNQTAKTSETKPQRIEPTFGTSVPTESAPGETKLPESPKPPETGREQLVALIAKLETQITETNAQRLRALADAENARKRAQRDNDEVRRYGAANLAREIVTVADNMRRAIAAVPPEAAVANPVLANLLDGMRAIERSFLAALEKHHVRQIAQVGVPFDPNLHQAMMQVETTAQPAGTIAEIMQPGYVLHDRLLRPAMVSIAKAPQAAPSPPAPPAPPPVSGGALDTTA